MSDDFGLGMYVHKNILFNMNLVLLTQEGGFRRKVILNVVTNNQNRSDLL